MNNFRHQKEHWTCRLTLKIESDFAETCSFLAITKEKKSSSQGGGVCNSTMGLLPRTKLLKSAKDSPPQSMSSTKKKNTGSRPSLEESSSFGTPSLVATSSVGTPKSTATTPTGSTSPDTALSLAKGNNLKKPPPPAPKNRPLLSSSSLSSTLPEEKYFRLTVPDADWHTDGTRI